MQSTSIHTKSSTETIKPKQIWPELHKKTHFNALTRYAIGPSIKSEFLVQNSGYFSTTMLNINKDLKRRQTMTVQETRLLARQVLEDCQVKKKSQKSYLHKGEGHLISNPDLNNTQVYSSIYRKKSRDDPSLLSASYLY